ncbi:MAG TPA: L,D-transpeptidase family protein [Gaiellaceae bacterium]|nr:L,D-transpeptidase family protein [Gaiellaceae bacterium]
MRGTIAAAAVLLALVAAAPADAAPASRAACPPTIANRLSTTGPATQLITVVAPHRTATQGQLELWRKVGDCWRRLRGPWTAWVGRRGVSPAKREGDRRTPSGAFGIGRVMYGVASNPGVRYSYRRIVCGDWWVEDSRSPHYNRFRHVPCGSTPPFRTFTEDLSRSPTAYRHFAVIDYNTNPVVPGRGSGIFLHASTGRPTIGCVSLQLQQLLAVLRWLRRERRPLIVIGTPADMEKL